MKINTGRFLFVVLAPTLMVGCASVTGSGKAKAPACEGEVVAYMPEEWEHTGNDFPAASPAARRSRTVGLVR